MFRVRLGRILWQENGKTCCIITQRTKNGSEETQLLLWRCMEYQVPCKIQMASSYLKTSTRIKNEKRKTQDGAWSVKENRGILLRKYFQEQKDPENHRKETKERQTT